MIWMIAIAIAAGVLTVSATSTRITPATVAPTCGMRSRNPVITASTIGNGNPKSQADRPATMAATSEIARLPISDEETAPMDSSSQGRQAWWALGGGKPNHPLGDVGASDQKNSGEEGQRPGRNPVPKIPPATPSSVEAASG